MTEKSRVSAGERKTKQAKYRRGRIYKARRSQRVDPRTRELQKEKYLRVVLDALHQHRERTRAKVVLFVFGGGGLFVASVARARGTERDKGDTIVASLSESTATQKGKTIKYNTNIKHNK
jgi:hypothetical protein